MAALLSSPTARGLSAIYVGTFFSGAWAMILPTIPVLAREFGVSAGGAAQIVTAFGAGKFCGTIVAGVLLDRAGSASRGTGAGPARMLDSVPPRIRQ